MESALANHDVTRLIEASQDCIKVLDLDGRLLSMNEGGMKALEICDFATVQGSYWVQFWEGADRQACETALEAARNGSSGRFVGVFPTTQTRNPRWWDVIINPIFGSDGKPEKLLAVSRDVTDWKRSEELLRAIAEGTAAATGTEFFRSLVKHLAQGLRVRWTFVTEWLPNLRARSLAFWTDSDFGKNFEYPLEGTICMEVAKGHTCHVPDRLSEVFPDDTGMIGMGAVSYLGMPLLNSEKQIIGHVVVFDDKPMPAETLALRVTETFAARAGVELERQQADEKLRRLNEENTALLNIHRAIGRHLDRDEMFAALADCLHSVVASDRFGIELPIQDGQLQSQILSPLGHSTHNLRSHPLIFPAQGTACDWVIQKREPVSVSFRDELSSRFPVTFQIMEKEHLQSLCALPLLTGDNCLGALFFMAKRPAAYRHLRQPFLEQVASTVAVALDDCLAHEEVIRVGEELAAGKVAELEQQQRRISDQLQQASEALDASEERFRDLFDEAPIACVHEGLDTRFIRANRAAMRILGIKPEEVAGTYGRSFVPDTPDAQRCVREAFESVGKGTDISGVVLELRRKDNGQPVWIRRWSKPDPSGTYTRTMFVDITDRVLMEQQKARLADSQPSSPLPDGNASLGEVERRHIESVLVQTKWVIGGEKGAAKILNLNPSTLRSRMRKLGINRPAREQQT